MTENCKILYEKIQFLKSKTEIFLSPMPILSTSKQQHPALQNNKYIYFFYFLWVIFVLLDPDPDPAK
jgi:hypothetical protein